MEASPRQQHLPCCAAPVFLLFLKCIPFIVLESYNSSYLRGLWIHRIPQQMMPKPGITLHFEVLLFPCGPRATNAAQQPLSQQLQAELGHCCLLTILLLMYCMEICWAGADLFSKTKWKGKKKTTQEKLLQNSSYRPLKMVPANRELT